MVCPFRALRPRPDDAGLVAAVPYDVAALELRQVAELPMTPTGKIAKALLREWAVAPPR